MIRCDMALGRLMGEVKTVEAVRGGILTSIRGSTLGPLELFVWGSIQWFDEKNRACLPVDPIA